MKILVTGGAGFIGKYLVQSLLKENTVTIYDNLENSIIENIIPLIESGAYFIKGDILDYESLKDASNGHDVIIHLAAKSNVSESGINQQIITNVNGTINVLKCCVQNKIEKIIFASSAAVYGDCNKIPINEEFLTNPISDYGLSKKSAENEIKKFADEFGIGYVILRLFNVYGKGQDNQNTGVISKFLKRISENKEIIIYGDGTQTRDFISINDIIDAFDCALKSDKDGIYNIGSGKSISIKELANIMFDSSGRRKKIKFEMHINGDINHSRSDITFAKKSLGFEAKTNIKEELSKMF